MPFSTSSDRDGEVLPGGRTTPGVVRIGDEVHRPASAKSPFIAALLTHLNSVGFLGAPRYLGRDSNGRDILSFLPGHVPSELGYFSDGQLTGAAALIRAFHDATVGFEGRGDAEVVCHGDLSPCNCVFESSMPAGLIDFDAARPGNRTDDLGYASWLWLDLGTDAIAIEEQRRRLKLFMAGYGRPANDPVASVLAAQRRLAADPSARIETRAWAKECELWTLRHLARSTAASPSRG